MPAASGSFGERNISRLMVCEIAKARMWEIFSKVKRAVEDAKAMQYVNSGIVLTGGGALLPGVDQVAEEVFKIPVRVGAPTGFTVDIEKDGRKVDGEIFANPRFAGAIGLAQLGLDMKVRGQMARKRLDMGKGTDDDMKPDVGDGLIKKVGKWSWKKIKSFAQDF